MTLQMMGMLERLLEELFDAGGIDTHEGSIW
jgi:hypothetical protein